MTYPVTSSSMSDTSTLVNWASPLHKLPPVRSNPEEMTTDELKLGASASNTSSDAEDVFVWEMLKGVEVLLIDPAEMDRLVLLSAAG